MENIIVRESASEIRAIARMSMKGIWKPLFAGMLIYYLLITTVPSLIQVTVPFGIVTAPNGDTFSMLSTLYHFAVRGAFEVGLCSFMLLALRKKDVHPGHVFDGFENYPKAFLLLFVMSFFTSLWMLLLFVPGVIAAIRYSQAGYILAEHPEKGVMASINESKAMMAGNKGRYFYLALTFVGWIFLANVPALMLDMLLSAWDYNAFYVLIMTIAEIPFVFALVYMHASFTVFYEIASGKLMAKPAEPTDEAL